MNLIHGDCLAELKKLPDSSIDLVVTDPPYGLGDDDRKGFMGKEWDVLPSQDIWCEVLRTLKPGAFAFVLCTPRQDSLSRMIVRMEDAGFSMRFTSIYWAYASGFPKASNISKMVDKRLGAEREKGSLNPHYCEGREKNSPNQVVGSTSLKAQPKYKYDKPATDAAIKLEGSYGGFQPKPAVEVVIVAMKPIEEKTYVDQALKNGKGITWLDDGRIPFQSEDIEIIKRKANKTSNGKAFFDTSLLNNSSIDRFDNMQYQKGRFPANLIIEDQVVDDGSISKAKAGIRHNKSGMGIHQSEAGTFGYGDAEAPYDDEGTFSRYFDLDAWFEEKIKELPKEARKTFPFLVVPKPSKREKNEGLSKWEEQVKGYGGGEIELQNSTIRPDGSKRQPVKTKNIHPTTKPLKLMSWLITLGSREKDKVLDMFMGSGTTGIAAHLLGRQFVGIEIEEEYYAIAKARIEDVQKQKRLEDW